MPLLDKLRENLGILDRHHTIVGHFTFYMQSTDMHSNIMNQTSGHQDPTVPSQGASEHTATADQPHQMQPLFCPVCQRQYQDPMLLLHHMVTNNHLNEPLLAQILGQQCGSIGVEREQREEDHKDPLIEFRTLREDVERHAIRLDRGVFRHKIQEYCERQRKIIEYEMKAELADLKRKSKSMKPVNIAWERYPETAVGEIVVPASNMKYFRCGNYLNLISIGGEAYANVSVVMVDEKKCTIRVLYEYGKYQNGYNMLEDCIEGVEKNNVEIHLLPKTANIEFCFNEIPFKRRKNALDELEKHQSDNDLIPYFMGNADCGVCPEIKLPPLTLLDKKMLVLNESQMSAVAKGLLSPFLMIQGPPGTGKTTTIACYVYYYLLVHPDAKILVCGPSNASTDQLACAIRPGIEILRKFIPGVSIARYYSTSATRRDRDLVDIDVLTLCANDKSKEGSRLKELVQKRRSDQWMTKEERKEFNLLYEQIRGKVFAKTSVLCCTTSMSGSIAFVRRVNKRMEDEEEFDSMEEEEFKYTEEEDYDFIGHQFDCVIVDEAAQAIDCECLIPFLRASKNVIFVGDHMQLGPTVKHADVINLERNGGISVFNRLKNSTMLTIQYRMHPVIAKLVSELFYGGRLGSDVTVADRTPQTLEFMWLLESCPIAFFNVNGKEEQENGSTSYINNAENRKTIEVLRDFQKRGVEASRIGVITPYADQTAALKQMLFSSPRNADMAAWAGDKLQINSVDGFQGCEMDYIILTCVRSNPDGDIGFFSDMRRVNVAITRARYGFIIIGNADTFRNPKQSEAKKWRDIIEYFDNSNGVEWFKNVLMEEVISSDVSPTILKWWDWSTRSEKEKLSAAVKLLELDAHALPPTVNATGDIWQALVNIYNRFSGENIKMNKKLSWGTLSAEVSTRVYKQIIAMIVGEIKRFKTVLEFARSKRICLDEALKLIRAVIQVIIRFNDDETLNTACIYPCKDYTFKIRKYVCRYGNCSKNVLMWYKKLLGIYLEKKLAKPAHPLIEEIEIPGDSSPLVCVKNDHDLIEDMENVVCSEFNDEKGEVREDLKNFCREVDRKRDVRELLPRISMGWINWQSNADFWI